MLTICPRCSHPLDGRTDCTACGYQPPTTAPAPVRPRDATPWQNTLPGRGAIGLVVTQGVNYGLVQLCKAVLFVVVGAAEQDAWWRTTTGLVLESALQAVSLLVGGALVGAGHPRGLVHGAILGLANSLVFLLVKQFNPKDTLNAWVLFGQPPFLCLFGAAGGVVGSSLWRPIKPLGDTPVPRRPAWNWDPGLFRFRSDWLAGPVNWLRVFAGCSVAVGGTFWANLIFRFIIDSSGGKLSIESLYQAKFVIWEIAVLALVLGGACAGANCRNGFKQGLVTAVIAALLLIILGPRVDDSTLPTHALAFDLLHLRTGLPAWLENFFFTLLSVVPLTTLGGWFGSQLIPPISGGRRFLSPY